MNSIRRTRMALAAGMQGALAVAYGALWVVGAFVVMVPVILGILPQMTEAMRACAHVLTLGIENDATMMAVFAIELIWLPAMIYGTGIALRKWFELRGTAWRTRDASPSIEDAA